MDFFLKSPLEKYFSIKQYIKIKKYLLPISFIFNLETPSFLFLQEFGITEYEYPRTILFNDSSIVKLK